MSLLAMFKLFSNEQVFHVPFASCARAGFHFVFGRWKDALCDAMYTGIMPLPTATSTV